MSKHRGPMVAVVVVFYFSAMGHGVATGARIGSGSITRTQANGCSSSPSGTTFTATTSSVVIVASAYCEEIYCDASVSLSGGPATPVGRVDREDDLFDSTVEFYQVFTGLTPGLQYSVDGGSCPTQQFSTNSFGFEVYEFLCPGGLAVPASDPEIAPFSWTLSTSPTDPFANRNASAQSTLYLWLVCAPSEGIAAAEFGLTGGTIASFSTQPGVNVIRSGNDLTLAFPCGFSPPARVGTITLTVPSSRVCLGPNGSSGSMASVACGSFEEQCSQVLGFADVAPCTSPDFCAGQPVTSQVYWSDRGGTHKIERSDATGGGRAVVVPTGQVAPSGVVARNEGNGGSLYWSQAVTTDAIFKARLDGTDAQDLVTTGLGSPLDLELDSSANELYWVDSEAPYDGIYKASIFGGVPIPVVTGILDGRGLALDVAGGKVYWTDLATDSIGRSDFDGANVETFLTFASTSQVGDIDFDALARQVYWADTGLQTIATALVDGAFPTTVTLLTSTQGLSFPNHVALDVYARKIFWSDFGTDTIRRATFEGTGVVDIATGDLSVPHGIGLLQSPIASGFQSEVRFTYPGLPYNPGFAPPVTVWFGAVAIGSHADATVALYNAGSTFAAGILIADCPQFTVLGDPSFALAPDEEATFTVRFAPTAAADWPVGELRAAEDCGLSSRRLLIGQVEPPSAVPGGVVLRYALHPPQPNPFNPRTSIRFDLPQPGPVRLDVFDVAGRHVRSLVAGASYDAGRHELVWEGRDDHGRAVASGVYLCRIQAGPFTATGRLALLK